MRKCKTKAIQTYFGTFKHDQANPRTILAYSKPCLTLAYLETWYIQSPDTFKIRNMFRTLVYSVRTSVYSELWHIQNPRLIQTYTMSNIYDVAFCENS